MTITQAGRLAVPVAGWGYRVLYDVADEYYRTRMRAAAHPHGWAAGALTQR